MDKRFYSKLSQFCKTSNIDIVEDVYTGLVNYIATELDEKEIVSLPFFCEISLGKRKAPEITSYGLKNSGSKISRKECKNLFNVRFNRKIREFLSK